MRVNDIQYSELLNKTHNYKMNIINTFIFLLVIQLLADVNCEKVSSLLNSDKYLRCRKPFLTLAIIGYIGCQMACVGHTSCDVLQYSKSHLVCYLHDIVDCGISDSAAATSYIVKRRSDIDVSIGGECRDSDCENGNACIRVKKQTNCFQDRVLLDNDAFDVIFVDINGVLFGMYALNSMESNAYGICTARPGRFAVLDTPIKVQMITDATQWYQDSYPWRVGVSRENGRWFWSNGVSAHIPITDSNADCAGIIGQKLDDMDCNAKSMFVCELL